MSLDRSGEQTATRRQLEACRSLATSRQWQVVDEIEDVDRSAYQAVNREGYEQLCRLVDVGAIDGVLVWKLDRLWRRPREFEQFWSTCERRRVFLASAVEPIDTSTELGLALVRILVTFAHLESATIGARIAARHRQRALEGRAHRTGRAYGLTDDWSAVVPEEAARILEAAQRVLAGESIRSIAADWRRRGIASATGTAWRPEVLTRILRSRRIAGEREYHGEMVAAGTWPAILDPLTAASVRAMLADGARRGRDWQRTNYLLTGLLVCGRCGAPLRGAGKAGRNKAAYGCPEPPTGCGRISINAEDTEVELGRRLLEHVASLSVPRSAAPVNVGIRALDDVSSRLHELCRDFYVNHLLDRAIFHEARRALLAERELLLLETDAFAPADDAATRWATAERSERRALVVQTIEQVVIHPARQSHGRIFDPSRIEVRWCRPDAARPTPKVKR